VTTIALEQLRSEVGNASASFDRIVGLARGAFAQGTGIAVFPELAVSGYTTDETVLRSVAAPVYGPAIAQVAEVAREHDGLVVLGFAEPVLGTAHPRRRRRTGKIEGGEACPCRIMAFFDVDSEVVEGLGEGAFTCPS
jgi:predicted amidohydrolase